MQMTIIVIHPEAMCMAKLLTFGSEKSSAEGKKGQKNTLPGRDGMDTGDFARTKE